eukprot:241433_1
MSFELSVPSRIDQLNELNEEEIKEMIKTPKLIKHFASDVAETLREMREQQQMEILRIAKSNLNKKNEIDASSTDNSALRNEIDELTAIYNNLQQRKEQVLQKFSRDKINQAINKETEKLNEQCETITDKFESNKIQV